MFQSPEFRFALEAVRRATQLAQRVQQEMAAAALTKEDRSPVTVGDYAAQALVAQMLRESFPDDLLVGEENAAALRAPEQKETLDQITRFLKRQIPSAQPEAVLEWLERGRANPTGRYWTVDPIDGTKGFLRGDQYAVCLALIENGQVQLGVIGCPHLNTRGKASRDGAIYVAARDGGAWVVKLEGEAEFVQLHVSETDDVRRARLLRSVETGHTDAQKIDEVVAALGVEANPVPMDSQAKYAVLAAGRGEVMARLISPSRPNYKEKIWDQAAGSLLVEEAGGRVTDLDGKPLDFRHGRTLAANRGVLATNGRLHDALLAALRQSGA